MNIADYLLGGASGINRSALKFADTVAGNPVAGLANALGADIDYNPLTRAAQSVGVGRDAVNDNQALAQALTGSVGDMAAGAVPLAGDVAGLRDDARRRRDPPGPGQYRLHNRRPVLSQERRDRAVWFLKPPETAGQRKDARGPQNDNGYHDTALCELP